MTSQTVDERPSMPTPEAATYCGSTPGTFKSWRCQGKSPAFYRGAGRRVLYKRSDLDAWLETCRVVSRSTATQRVVRSQIP